MVSSSATSRGRAKRAKALETAARVFCECGYRGTSMDAIALAAGMSKATLYRHFSDKEGLFRMIVEDRASSLRVTGEHLRPTDAPAIALRRIGSRFLQAIHAPLAIGLFRVMLSESHQVPGLATAFFELGVTPSIAHLSSYLAVQHAAGVLHVPDPERTAHTFFLLLRGELHERRLLGLAPEPSGTALRDQLAHAIDDLMAIVAEPRRARSAAGRRRRRPGTPGSR